jgi:hypothetical protein
MASLDSVRQKINHVKLHLHSVKSEIQGYLDTNPGEFVPGAPYIDSDVWAFAQSANRLLPTPRSKPATNSNPDLDENLSSPQIANTPANPAHSRGV